MKAALFSATLFASALLSTAADHDGCGSATGSPTMAPTSAPTTLAPTAAPTKAPVPGEWVNLGGFAHEISFDGKNACVKTGDGAFCGLPTQPFAQWKKVATTVDPIEQVATANGLAFVWGGASGARLMQTVDLASGVTHNTPLRADESPRQFSTDGKTVVGTTDSRFFGAAVVNGAMDSPVTIADSDSLDVYKTAIAGNDVYITDYEGVIKYSTLDSSAWTVRPFGYVDTDFRARELASDGVDLCVITYSLEIACAKLATGLETWTTYPGKWQAIAVANNTLTAVAFVDRDIQVTQLK